MPIAYAISISLPWWMFPLVAITLAAVIWLVVRIVVRSQGKHRR